MPIKLQPKYHYAGVYMIKNKRNGKVYIGSSENIEKRIYEHRLNLENGKHHNKDLQNDYDNGCPMTVYVLYVESVPNDIVPAEVFARIRAMERKYIDEYNSIETGYNRAPVGKRFRGVVCHQVKIEECKS